MIRLASVAVVLAATACGNENAFIQDLPPLNEGEAKPPETVEQIDVIVQVTTPKVDVLYTIDNSCSMYEEQAALTDNFPFFIGYFLGSGLDYHVGVTSTDMDGYFGPNGSEGRLRQVQGYKWIDENTANAPQVFTGMAAMGTSGSGIERGTSGTYACLELKRDTANSGFYRDEASIHTVLVSDEPNQIRGGELQVPEFVDWYDGLKREADERTFSSIVAQNGTDYRNITNQIGGINWNLADENWRVVLDRLGVQASGLKREYFLSQLPVNNTIVVQVAQPIEGDDDFNVLEFERATLDAKGNNTNEGDWTYDGTRNSITFLNFVPIALSRVIITYDLLAATQDDDLEQDVNTIP